MARIFSWPPATATRERTRREAYLIGKDEVAQRLVERRVGGGRLLCCGERRMNDLERTSLGPASLDGVGRQDEGPDIGHLPVGAVTHVAEAQVDAEPGASGCRGGQTGDHFGQSGGQQWARRRRSLRQQHQLGRDLDLEVSLRSRYGRDPTNLPERGLGEGPPMPQRPDRSEREHGHIEVARDTLLERQVRTSGARPGLLELRKARAASTWPKSMVAAYSVRPRRTFRTAVLS